MDEIRNKLRKKAIVLEIGGFRPSENHLSSWFGKANVCLPGESWPEMNGEPMHALCQINLSELPFRPPRLGDIELITVFIGPQDLPIDASNGQNWCLRAYKDASHLVPLTPRSTNSIIKPLPMRPVVIEEDFPCWEDVTEELAEEIEDNYYDLFENVHGLKLGGWPTLIQSEIFWAPWNRHPANPEYVFQIASTDKGGWSWGDGGVGYFGRGTTPGMENVWTLQWQCY